MYKLAENLPISNEEEIKKAKESFQKII